LAPDPPAGDLWIEEVWICHNFFGGWPGDFDEPPMAGMEVGFVDWAVSVFGYLIWICLQGAPEVGQVTIEVVYGLDAGIVRALEENGQRTGERFVVGGDVTEAVPDDVGDAAFASEPWEWGFHWLVTWS
jgi:hypothetical protein